MPLLNAGLFLLVISSCLGMMDKCREFLVPLWLKALGTLGDSSCKDLAFLQRAPGGPQVSAKVSYY